MVCCSIRRRACLVWMCLSFGKVVAWTMHPSRCPSIRRVATSLTVLPKTNDSSDASSSSSSSSSSTMFSSSTVFEDETTDDNRFALDDSLHIVDNLLNWAPVFIPCLAYALYDPTAEVFAYVLDALARNNWVAVDGGAYQARIIAPAVNGVVVPAISILFANLIGTTISTLRQRQLDIKTSINVEAGQLRILQFLLDVFPHNVDRMRLYLTQYTTRLIAESQPTVRVEFLDYSMDTELNGILRELNQLSVVKEDPPSPLILGNAYTACSKLYEERAKRITALRSLFPTLHYMIVTVLATAICVAFLLETKQDILVFLNAIQLRILWTMLVGTFSALAIVCYDLQNPFRGNYQISKSVDQLYTIRLALRASLRSPSNVSNKEDKEELSRQHVDKDDNVLLTTTAYTVNNANGANGESSSNKS